MPADRSLTDYFEAGAGSGPVRTQRRWRDISFAGHLAIVIVLIAPWALVVTQPEDKETKVVVFSPPPKPTSAPEVKHSAPPPQRPKLMLLPAKIQPIKPEVPVSQRVAPEQVELVSPSFQIIDDRNQMDQVLTRFQAVVAFSAKKDYGYYTIRFRAPDWQSEPIPGGMESSGGYCSFDIPGFSVPQRLCRQKNVSCDWNAYAGFTKSQCQLMYQDVKRFAGSHGYQRVQSITIRFSAESDSGFEVVDVTGSTPAMLQER